MQFALKNWPASAITRHRSGRVIGIDSAAVVVVNIVHDWRKAGTKSIDPIPGTVKTP